MVHYKVPGFRSVSAREVRELLKQPSTRDETLSTMEARVFADGRVLLLPGEGKGALYPSRESLQELNRRSEELMAKGPVDLTLELLPPQGEFLRDIDAHATRLGAALRVPAEALDRTEPSLDAVDKGVWRLAQAKRMTPGVITPLVAYVGEVMRLACDGRWMTIPGNNEPMVTARDGRLYQPFAIVLIEVERGRGGSLRGAVAGALRSRFLSR